MSPAELRDMAARRAAQTVFERPLVLTAGAGTGKTSALVARIVVWCVGQGWERAAAHALEPEAIAPRVLRRVVAITFTDAAAAEMAARVARALAQLGRGEIPEGVFEDLLPVRGDDWTSRARHLLTHLDELGVRTIHAYCRRLLAAHPIEAGLHPGFEIDADGTRQAQVVREVIERRLRADWARGEDAGYERLARRGHDPADLERALGDLLAADIPADALEADPFADRRVQNTWRELHEAIASIVDLASGRLDAVPRTSVPGQVMAALRHTLEVLDRHPDAGREAIADLAAELAATWDEGLLGRIAAWGRGSFVQGEAAALGADADALARACPSLPRMLRHASQLDPPRLDDLRGVLGSLAREVEGELRARGIEGYTALLRDATRLLDRHPEVSDGVRADVDQLLVDELQDTDATQCAILRALALAGSIRPGLLIVGDPKQSIYGWRSADLEAYEGLVADVMAAGGERHELVVNFRSAPAILDEVERAIRPQMVHRPGIQAEFRSLVPCPDRRADPGFHEGDLAPVEYWVSWGWAPGRDQLARPGAVETAAIEARAVARDLLGLRDCGQDLGDVGLLFRTRGDLDVYLRELRAHDIPYQVAGDRGYYRRGEVIEAAALLRCAVDPHDHLSLLTWLRSASVGVPDAALLPLWQGGLPRLAGDLGDGSGAGLEPLHALVARVAGALPADVPGIERIEGWPRALTDGLRALEELRRSFETDPGDVFVERLRTRTLIEATESARHQGAYRVANLDRFFRRIGEALSSDGADAQALLRGLRRAVAESAREEEGRPLDATTGAVRVMTIHQAKGLDFEHVYLLQSHREGRQTPEGASTASLIDGCWEYEILGVATPGHARATARAREIAEAEAVRTLYVALTRARRRLVIAGRWPGARETALGRLAGRQGGVPDLSSLGQELVAAPGAPPRPAHRDEAGVRWVFPVLRADAQGIGADALSRPSDEVGVPDACVAARDAERLRVASAEASTRMRRLIGRAASSEVHERLRAGGGAGAPGPGRRAIATAVGGAIHRLLEEIDLEDPAEPRLDRTWLGDAVPEADLDAALAEAETLWGRISRGRLLARLRDLAPRILARELPVLLPPMDGEDEALGFVEGVVDLVYRDAESGRLVVADYKTDRVQGPRQIAERVDVYRPQVEAYARAVRDGLDLEEPPRRELWFLHADEIVRL